MSSTPITNSPNSSYNQFINKEEQTEKPPITQPQTSEINICISEAIKDPLSYLQTTKVKEEPLQGESSSKIKSSLKIPLHIEVESLNEKKSSRKFSSRGSPSARFSPMIKNHRQMFVGSSSSEQVNPLAIDETSSESPVYSTETPPITPT